MSASPPSRFCDEDWRERGRTLLLDSRSPIVGAGGLATGGSFNLAERALVRYPHLMTTVVSLSNLATAIQFETNRCRPAAKVEVVARRLSSLNADTVVTPRQVRLTNEPARALLCGS